MGSVATGAGLFDRLFGPDVSGVMARLDGAIPDPQYADEARAVANAVARRRHEFLVGRACAHAALAAIGRDGVPIAVGRRRRPLWPPGVVGSIAHGGHWAAAVVAATGHVAGLGLDIEPLGPPLTAGAEALVLTTAERRRLPPDHAVARRWAKVAFTAKEAVYKALNPSTGWALDHADVDIDIDLAAGRWHATLADGFPLEGGGGLAGRFEVADDHLFTAVVWWIPNTHG